MDPFGARGRPFVKHWNMLDRSVQTIGLQGKSFWDAVFTICMEKVCNFRHKIAISPFWVFLEKKHGLVED
jgi:hypothetical protein